MGDAVIHHEMKCSPTYFDDVISGRKGFELRRDDRGIEIGDTIVLKEFGALSGYSGREISVAVRYVLRGFAGLEAGYCIVGFSGFEWITR